MFVRFRKTPRRLQVSILETRRTAEKVTNEHIASLGSIAVPMEVSGRQLFWANMWDRLTSLSNRIGADDQAKIRNAVHARIPMVMPEEANTAEAAYWEKWSKSFVEDAVRQRERAAQAYQNAIKRAEGDENIAAIFAENRAAALKGERPMELGVVGQILAAKAGFRPETPAGTPCVMANGEAGVVGHYKRPNRHDRRRRRNGIRFTPKPVDGWVQSPFSRRYLDL